MQTNMDNLKFKQLQAVARGNSYLGDEGMKHVFYNLLATEHFQPFRSSGKNQMI